MPAEEVLRMETIESARCLGWEEEVGSLEPGKKADLCVVNPATPNMQPVLDPVSNLVFSMKTENIESTMCGGVWLMREKRFTNMDLGKVLKEAAGRAKAVRERAGVVLPERFNWVR